MDSFTKPAIAFAKCLTSDNVTLKNYTICGKYSLLYNYCDSLQSHERALTSQELVQNGWILHSIDSIYSSNQYFIFYKVSSD